MGWHEALEFGCSWQLAASIGLWPLSTSLSCFPTCTQHFLSGSSQLQCGGQYRGAILSSVNPLITAITLHLLASAMAECPTALGGRRGRDCIAHIQAQLPLHHAVSGCSPYLLHLNGARRDFCARNPPRGWARCRPCARTQDRLQISRPGQSARYPAGQCFPVMRTTRTARVWEYMSLSVLSKHVVLTKKIGPLYPLSTLAIGGGMPWLM